jgi:hypothetical protein
MTFPTGEFHKEWIMHINDIMIHVNESLGPDAQRGIEDSVRAVEGVISPRFNDQTPHLMIVAYNTDYTSAHALLDVVQDSGYSGQVVYGGSGCHDSGHC